MLFEYGILSMFMAGSLSYAMHKPKDSINLRDTAATADFCALQPSGYGGELGRLSQWPFSEYSISKRTAKNISGAGRINSLDLHGGLEKFLFTALYKTSLLS